MNGKVYIDPRLPICFTAKQLADLKLRGLPDSQLRVRQQAKRDGWPHSNRTCPDGEKLYWTAFLPIEAVKDLNGRVREMEPRGRRPIGRPRGTDYFTRHPDIASTVVNWLATRKLTTPQILQILHEEFGHAPSKRTMQRFVARTKNEDGAA